MQYLWIIISNVANVAKENQSRSLGQVIRGTGVGPGLLHHKTDTAEKTHK